VLLLAIDTSTPAVTTAVHDGSRVVADGTVVDARKHTELLAPQVSNVLRAAGVSVHDLTEVAVGVGPGPFTGLRVGLATAHTLAGALDLPIYGVCSLDVIAFAVAKPSKDAGRGGDRAPGGDFVVAIDARRKEVYWAQYRGDGSRLTDPDVGPAAELPRRLPAAGAGSRLYPDAFGEQLEPEYPYAKHLAEAVASGAVPLVDPEPMYLRHADATPPSAPKSVLT
jgi:tRNA threonylcarbamoyl adenosine modification protein YeaZ